MLMADFWSLPYAVVVELEDAAMSELAEYLERWAVGEWDYFPDIYESNAMMFRFAAKEDAAKLRFFVDRHPGYPIKRVECPD